MQLILAYISITFNGIKLILTKSSLHVFKTNESLIFSRIRVNDMSALYEKKNSVTRANLIVNMNVLIQI